MSGNCVSIEPFGQYRSVRHTFSMKKNTGTSHIAPLTKTIELVIIRCRLYYLFYLPTSELVRDQQEGKDLDWEEY